MLAGSLGIPSEVEAQTLALPLSAYASFMGGRPATQCGGGYRALANQASPKLSVRCAMHDGRLGAVGRTRHDETKRISDTRSAWGTDEGSRLGSARLKINLPARPEDIDAVWVVAVIILYQRFGGSAGRRKTSVIRVVAARWCGRNGVR